MDATNHVPRLQTICNLLPILWLSIQCPRAAVRAEPSNLEHSFHAETPRNYPDLPVLGYVTPWNARGKQIVDEHREKFDIISPVWYTVHPSTDPAEVYTVRGGPPADEDEEWYKQLQQPSPQGLKPLRIVPRFILDNWDQDDYRNLLFNETRWEFLAHVIEQVVDFMAYDGVVFESAATHSLSKPLLTLSNTLHSHDKLLILVMPPIRTGFDSMGEKNLDSRARIIIESLKTLGGIPDYFSIMTYDMSGPGGHGSLRGFPPNSQVGTAQKGGKVREPGPNTSTEWILDNLEAFNMICDNNDALFAQQQCQFEQEKSKFLMGLPLYGYIYPIMFVDEQKGTIAPSQRNSQKMVAILRGSGEAITMPQIQDLITKHQPNVEEVDGGGSYFDYTQDDGPWRLFMPTTKSMTDVLDALSDEISYLNKNGPMMGVGVALWEIGQSSNELLSAL